jgi:hypothetical protein
MDEEFTRRLARYESIARETLFQHRLTTYVNDLGMAELDAHLKARNLSTVWSDRTDTRTAKEKALVSDIIREEK